MTVAADRRARRAAWLALAWLALAWVALALLALWGAALIQPARGDTPADFAWSQHLGAPLPLDAPLSDEAGRSTSLRAIMGKAPAILDLDYYHCPSLCGVVRADAYAALATSGLRIGPDVSLISVSIDAAETQADAARARRTDLARAGLPSDAEVHYLTGPPSSLAAIEGAAGFHKRYDSALKQFLHPAGIVVLTRGGLVSAYILGVGYSGGDLRAAVLRAGNGGIARAALPILLLCFHYDSTTGRYTLAIEKVLRLAAAITVVMLSGLLLALHRRKALPIMADRDN